MKIEDRILVILTASFMMILGFSLITGTDYFSLIFGIFNETVLIMIYGFLFFLGGIILFILMIMERM